MNPTNTINITKAQMDLLEQLNANRNLRLRYGKGRWQIVMVTAPQVSMPVSPLSCAKLRALGLLANPTVEKLYFFYALSAETIEMLENGRIQANCWIPLTEAPDAAYHATRGL